MSQKPSFLRNEATKKKSPPGLQTKTGIAMISEAISQVIEAFRVLIRPEAPKQSQRASAGPMGRGPFSDVRRGPAPPPGAVRHDHSGEEEGEGDNNDENR